MATKKKPILSIGIIIKDEIRCIEKCLEALTPLRAALPCELVIADTGSTDGSRKIAEKYADILFDFPWIDDFAAARNAVMERCSGVWYLSIDSDEYLDADIKEIVDFFNGSGPKDKNTGFINIRNYVTNDLQNSDYTDFNAHRFVKMSTGVRYDGIIHERFLFDNLTPKVFFLLNTTLHHDGYVRTTDEERKAMKKKSDRNMTLLRKKIEESPDDMTYLQCIESSHDSNEQLDFAKRALEHSKKNNYAITSGSNNNILNVMLCRAVSVLLIMQNDNAEKELSLLDERLNDFLMFDLDVSFAAISYYARKKEWEKTLSYVETFEKSYDRYQTEGKSCYEFIISPAFYGYNKNKQQSKIFKAEALINLEREDDALDILKTVDFIPLCHASQDIGMVLRLLIDLNGDKRAVEVFKSLHDTINNLEANSKEAKKILNGFFINAIKTANKNENYRLMQDCDGLFGFCSKILSTDDPSAIEELSNNWDEVALLPAQILFKIIKVTKTLPQSFFDASSNHHLAAATNLSQIPDFASTLLAFVRKNYFHDDVARTNFTYHCVSALIQKGNYTNAEWDILCRMFLMFSDSIIHKIYNEELLNNSELWKFCISNHQLSLIIMRVRDLVLKGDEIGVITTLRSALDVTKTSKNLVSYLIDNAARLFSKPAPELVTLADKLKTLLATYNADDPFAVEIKNSDAYKQIAYLVELPTKEELGL